MQPAFIRALRARKVHLRFGGGGGGGG
jgi:hypothetical protein